MAQPTNITTGVQTVSATGAITPTTGFSISAITGDFTLVLDVSGLTTGKTAIIQAETSVNAFAAVTAAWVEQFTGQVVDGGKDIRRSKRKYELPSSGANVFGTSSAAIRFNVTALDSGATLSLQGWIER